MAKETKFIQVHPQAVEDTIEVWHSFGWEMVGAPQEIYNKDSHLEQRGDTQYSVTETTHYVKITFQRDNKMPNYAELVSLERKYDAINPYHPGDQPKKLSWLIAIGLGIFYIIPGVIYVIVKSNSYPKRLAEWENAIKKYNSDWQTKENIANQARAILDS